MRAAWLSASAMRPSSARSTLQPGETMRFANDHDPLPLLAQIAQRYGDRVGVEYRQRRAGRDRDDFGVR